MSEALHDTIYDLAVNWALDRGLEQTFSRAQWEGMSEYIAARLIDEGVAHDSASGEERPA